MKPLSKLNAFLNRFPLHFALIFMCVLWLIPTLGLFISSFRNREDVRTSGWWHVFTPAQQSVGKAEYDTYCASCHGADGKKIPTADLSSPELVARYPRSNGLLTMLKQDVNGQPHVVNPALPENTTDAMDKLSAIVQYMNALSGQQSASGQLTLNNYADALVGYKGTQDYLTDCKEGVPSALAKFSCTSADLLNPEGMGSAFLNTLIVTIPATILPIIFGALAAYAFAWLDFKGRTWIFAALVGLQVVPLQMTLVPIARLYNSLGLQDTFLGIWMFHTGFGLPYAIYLLRNFMGDLPREVFESAYLDGASHWQAFIRLALPLTKPAIASLGIFQFLWVWNDFLVAKIFLSSHPVLTVQITNLIDPRGANWHILTAAAFLSIIVPMLVFFFFQKDFVRGMTAGAVKG